MAFFLFVLKMYQIIVDNSIKIVYSYINKTYKSSHNYNTTPVKARRMLDRESPIRR